MGMWSCHDYFEGFASLVLFLFISLKAVGEVSEIIGNYKKEKEVTKGLTFILDLGEDRGFTETAVYLSCCVICSLNVFDLSLQLHWSEPATQISFAVMMAGALPHPGSVMGTMTVVT